MAKRRFKSVDVQSNNRCGHHRKARVLTSHLMDRAVGSLNSQLHQIFYVVAITDAMSKRFLENVNSRLRSYFAGLRAADAISDCKYASIMISQKRILVNGTLFV